MAVPQKAKELHNKLITELNDYVNKDVDRNDYEKVRNRLKTKLSPLALKEAGDKHIMDMVDKLEKRGEVKPGHYDVLKNIFDDIDVRWSDMIKEKEEEIKRIIQEAKSGPSNDQENKGKERRQPSPKAEAMAKRRREDNSDTPKPGEYTLGENQTGLVLLFNFNKDREGSEYDVQKIRDFFENIRFSVQCKEDLTKENLEEFLEEKKTMLNLRSEADRYYCLFVIVMAHGDKGGICTHDNKTVPLENIINKFKNDQIPQFAGKPRVFIIQSCRGDEAQNTVDLPDEQRLDVSDLFPKMSVPYDSDILTAYATTSGYQAFRRTNYGSWFVGSLVEVFQEKYERDHVEEMLIDVKDRVVAKFQTFDKKKQMPCTMSTFRKRLYLSRSTVKKSNPKHHQCAVRHHCI